MVVAGLLTLGQALLLGPAAVTAKPLGGSALPQPLGGYGGHGVEGSAQGFGDRLQAVDHAHGRQHPGGVGALATPRLEPAALPEAGEHDFQQAVALGNLPANRRVAELA